jgi:16S rRNA (cytosine1407-C5)-methyltransferase
VAKISSHYIEHIQQQIGEEKLEKFLHYCQLPLRKSIRINTLKITHQDFFNRVEKYQWKFQPIAWCKDGFWITRPDEEDNRLPLGNTLEHLAGLFYIQEASSMLPAQALRFGCEKAPITASKILDMAAAPGSKTTHLSMIYDDKSLIVANELSGSRVKSLYASLRRCGVTNYCLSHRDGNDFGTITSQQFDAVLLDAPCGGEGTVRKDPNALRDWNFDDLASLSFIQKSLIDSAFASLKPGGVLVYSTCTISEQENQQVCNHLMQNENCQVISLDGLFEGAELALTAEGYLHVLPQYYDSEGFFVACFKKPAEENFTAISTALKVSGNWQYLMQNIQQLFEQYLTQQFSFDLTSLNGNLLLKQSNNYQEIWLFPENFNNELLQSIKPKRCGIRLAEVRIKKQQYLFKLTHEFILAWGSDFSKNTLQASTEEARQFLLGKDLNNQQHSLTQGECLVCTQGKPLGLAKVINNRIKNNIPRELILDKLNW